MTKVCIVVATAFTVKAFLLDHIAHLSRRYHITLAANDLDEAAFGALCVTLVHVPIKRRIALFADLRSLLRLYRVLRRERFTAVHSFTPKAGLLTMVAAFAARVPVRIHTFTGQVWATLSGPSRLLFKTLDRATAAAATHILVDSPSQWAFLKSEGILRNNRGEVLAQGSISGVDGRRFKPDPAARAAVRRERQIADDAIVILFVGRLTRDKGVLELACAYSQVAAARGDVHLMIVGPDEEGLQAAVTERCGPDATRVHFIGHTAEPERCMAAADVFCLPSHREGFGSVILEAAACGLPAVGSRIYGITDAIQDGVTGLLVNVGDIDGLASALLALVEDEPLRRRLALAARDRALNHFSGEALTEAWLDFYARVIETTARARTQEAAPKGT